MLKSAVELSGVTFVTLNAITIGRLCLQLLLQKEFKVYSPIAKRICTNMISNHGKNDKH